MAGTRASSYSDTMLRWSLPASITRSRSSNVEHGLRAKADAAEFSTKFAWRVDECWSSGAPRHHDRSQSGLVRYRRMSWRPSMVKRASSDAAPSPLKLPSVST